MYKISVPNYLRNRFIAAIILIIIASIRFNRNDLIIQRPLNDAAFYISNVEKMRGIDPTTYDYKGPFNERILVTTLASVLPFSPLTSINLINLLFLLAGLFFLHKLLIVEGLYDNLVWIGIYIFIFSFPTFYYSTIGYIDPSVLAAIFGGVYALYANKYGLFILAVIAGAFSKENIIILIPVALAYAYSRKKIQWYFIALLAGMAIFLINYMMRIQLAHINDYLVFWEPKLYRITHNLTRPNFVISTLLSWGIPLAMGIYYFTKNHKAIFKNWKDELPLWTGIGCIIATTIYMIIAAFPDGRNVWVAYCFPILLALKWWKNFSSQPNDITHFLEKAEPGNQINQQ